MSELSNWLTWVEQTALTSIYDMIFAFYCNFQVEKQYSHATKLGNTHWIAAWFYRQFIFDECEQIAK